MRTKVQMVVAVGDDEPRIFDAVVCAPIGDIQRGVTEGVQAFNKALHESLERARAAHATASTEHAA